MSAAHLCSWPPNLYPQQLHRRRKPKLFYQSPHLTNVVSQNSLIDGYFKHSHIQQAEYLFDQMPHRDVIFWNTNALSG
uniref:Pentatricopeptide repeat-containing protein n=1 Tax=Solanum lycopersicum TaxID=4081 RepID=A0A3Q7GNM3_SOLLC